MHLAGNCLRKDHVCALNAAALQLAIVAKWLHILGVAAFLLEQAACLKVQTKHSCNIPNLLCFVLSCAALTHLPDALHRPTCMFCLFPNVLPSPVCTFCFGS